MFIGLRVPNIEGFPWREYTETFHEGHSLRLCDHVQMTRNWHLLPVMYLLIAKLEGQHGQAAHYAPGWLPARPGMTGEQKPACPEWRARRWGSA